LSENPNIRYAVRNRVGYYVGVSTKRFVRRVRELMEAGALARVQASYERLALKNGADDIARFLNAVLSGQQPPSHRPSSPARLRRRRQARQSRATARAARSAR
jgi:hypothetical protein